MKVEIYVYVAYQKTQNKQAALLVEKSLSVYIYIHIIYIYIRMYTQYMRDWHNLHTLIIASFAQSISIPVIKNNRFFDALHRNDVPISTKPRLFTL